MDFRTQSLLLWGLLACVQVFPALYFYQVRRHLLLAVSLLGMFFLLTWQKILWVFWADYPLEKTGWTFATCILILCSLFISGTYLGLVRFLPKKQTEFRLSKISEPPVWIFLFAVFFLVPEISPASRETHWYLSYTCIETLLLAWIFLHTRYLRVGLIAVVCIAFLSFLSTGSMAFGVRVFEVAILIGILRAEKRYWALLGCVVLSLSVVQTVKARYREEVARDANKPVLARTVTFVQSFLKTPAFFQGEDRARGAFEDRAVTYYGYGIEALTSPNKDPKWAGFFAELYTTSAKNPDFYKGYLRYVLGMASSSRWALGVSALDQNIAVRFAQWNGAALFPIFQLSSSRFYTRDEKCFLSSPRYQLEVIPRQTWNNRLFMLTRGLLRVGDDTLDRVLTHSPSQVPFWQGHSYSIVNHPRRMRETANLFGRVYGYLAFWDEQTTVTFNQFSEGYMNFGLTGLIVTSIFYGFLLCALELFLLYVPSGIREVGFVCLGRIIFLPKESTALVSGIFFTVLCLFFLTPQTWAFPKQERI